jgi:hypothetical protein
VSAFASTLFFALAAFPLVASAAVDSKEASVHIATAGDLPLEREAVAQLKRLFERYDLSRWINTSDIVIQSRVIPHSHPVLTLNTRFAPDDDLNAMSTFVHEQGHWYFDSRQERTNAAIAELGALFPQTPGPDEGAARDRQSTLLHLLVCTLEYDAMVTLIGAEQAKQVIADRDIYTWVYERVLSATDQPGIRAVMKSHGLDTY